MSGTHINMTEFADLARALGLAAQDADRLQLAVEAAVDLIDGCTEAGITINRDGECLTLAATSEGVVLANKLQNELGEGPCQRADRTEETLLSTDLLDEGRWPAWGKRLGGELGLGSMMSLIVYSGRRQYGTLSLYGAGARAFDADDLATAQALAGHLAVSLAASQEIDGLAIALANRTVIGQAEGILMERLGLDADQALAYLKRVSSHTNTKVSAVAMELVRTRELPTA